jgi:hypothetical protein
VIPSKSLKTSKIGQGNIGSIQTEVEGRILVRLQQQTAPAAVKGRIIYRKGKHPGVVIGHSITREEVREALGDFS